MFIKIFIQKTDLQFEIKILYGQNDTFSNGQNDKVVLIANFDSKIK
jgi:hypothetical protein